MKSINRQLKDWHKIITWTSWYCPVKGCNTIIYNTGMNSKYKIEVHKREHKV